MLTQNEELKSFITQATTSCGKSPSSMTHDRMDRSSQILATKAYVAEFTSKHVWQELTEENNNPQVFVPASGVRHRLMKRKHIERTFVNRKKLKKGRGNAYKTVHVGLRRQLQEAKLILADENADVPIDCSPPCGQELPEENFPEAVLTGLGVRKVPQL